MFDVKVRLALVQAFNKGSREAAEHVSRIQSQIAMSDTGSVSSDQSGKGTRVSAPRASTQPDNKSRAQPNMGAAAVADQVKLPE